MIKPTAVLFAPLALLLVTTGARAQSASAASDVATITAPRAPSAPSAPTDSATAGPTVEAASIGFRTAPAAAEALESDALARQGFGRAETFMVVGGAAFVAGILIGDDVGTVVMLGGAVMGLYGLWLYLQQH
ncbi:MAG TPA: hypothetical protein VMM18_01350 [Gemmatimonadaceae bacterium]|nr:hypothetical protein [Gemmatimonadaceae bacterium]